MPVEGMPDSNVHRLCFRCHKWFHSAEGVDYDAPGPSSAGISGLAVAVTRLVAGPENRARFLCHRCARFRRWVGPILWIALFAIAGIVLLLEQLGVLQ